MSGQKFFRVPFALTGDKTAVPDPAQGSGAVSYTEGFGFDYERDPGSDPAAKRVPRDETNQLYFDITDNLRQYQMAGFPEFVPAAQNDGVAVSYPLGAYVRYDIGGGTWAVFASTVANNTALPTDATKWRVVDPFNQALFTASNADLQATATAKTNVFATPAAIIRNYREGRWDNLGVVAMAAGKTLSGTYADGGAFSVIAGARVTFRMPSANTATPVTLNVNAGGALPLYNSFGQELAAADLQADRVYQAVSNSVAWFMVTPVPSQFATYGAATTLAAGIIRIATGPEAAALALNTVALTPANAPLATDTQKGFARAATILEAKALALLDVFLTPGNIPLATTGQGGIVRYANDAEAAARTAGLAVDASRVDMALSPRLRPAPTTAGAGVTNWNNVKEAGWYFASGAANSPPGLANVNVFVTAVDATTVLQEATQISSLSGANTNTYRRVFTGGAWSAWFRVYASGPEIQGVVTVPNRLAADASAALPLPTDWNTVKDAGWYTATAAANAPAAVAANALSVKVENIGLGNVQQTATAIGVATEADTKTYRRFFTGAWSAWFKLPQSGPELEAAAAAVGFLPGEMKTVGHANVPAGWYYCDGAAYSRTTDAALFAAIGTAYGVGNGATTFNIPDMRGRTGRGVDDGAGRDGPALGQARDDQVGDHTHPIGNSRAGARFDGGGGNTAMTQDGGYTPVASGTNGAGENRVKELGVRWLIKR